MEDSHTLNTTLPISSIVFDGLHSPTDSYSNMTEPLPPSITSTPLGLASPRHWRTTLAESRQSMASLYTSPSFNFPRYPAVGPSNLTPSVPSIAGSHHVSSTWPPDMFTSGPSTPQLTIDQANSIFNFVAECQALSIKLAKKFQVLSGLEAMHRNSIQGMAHETLTLGCSAWEAAYSAILWDGISKAECEATTHHLRSEADTAWKEMYEVMYNHQLNYDRGLSAFLTEMETTLNNMRDQVWAAIHALAENEGITFNDCLGLMLQVLNLLPQIPIDVSFQTQIPLTITYCPEFSIYRRWCPEQGSVSTLHKEVRASNTLSKVLGGSPTTQVRAWIIPHLQLLLTTLQDQAGCGTPEINHTAVPKVSSQPTAGNQALWAPWHVISLSSPMPPKVARNQAANPNSLTTRRMPLSR